MDINQLIYDWAQEYAPYSEGQAVEEWFLVYGSTTDVNAIGFTTETSGSFDIITGGEPISVGIQHQEVKQRKFEEGEVVDNKVKLKVEDVPYEFTLEEGENFYFILRSGEGGVATG